MGKLAAVGLVVGCLGFVPSMASAQGVGSEELDPEAATEAYLALMAPEERSRSDSYHEGQHWLRLWSFLYTVAVGWVLLTTRAGVALGSWVARLTPRPWLQTLLYVPPFVMLVNLLYFPLTLYRGYVREHAYGLATQSLGPWMRDQVVGGLLTALLLSLLLGVLYSVARRAPHTWWLWGSGISVVFLVLVVLLLPVLFLPLFNTYRPLEDETLKARLAGMAQANGIPVQQIYQVDTSPQDTRISASVSGFAGTLRIALNDNLIERCSVAEIEAVMGHEMGHYVLNHAYERVLFYGALLLLGFAFLRLSFPVAVNRWGERWRISGISDLGALPLVMILASIFLFLMTPVLNTYVRSNETEADDFGLNAAGEPDGFAEVALKLGEYRKLDPGLLEEWLLHDHPSGRRRILMAMRFKAESEK